MQIANSLSQNSKKSMNITVKKITINPALNRAEAKRPGKAAAEVTASLATTNILDEFAKVLKAP